MKRMLRNLSALFLAFTLMFGNVAVASAAEETAMDDAKTPVKTEAKAAGYTMEKLKPYQEGYLGKALELNGKLLGVANAKEVYHAIFKAMRAMNTVPVNLYNYKLSGKQLETVVSQVVHDNPQLYYALSEYFGRT